MFWRKRTKKTYDYKIEFEISGEGEKQMLLYARGGKFLTGAFQHSSDDRENEPDEEFIERGMVKLKKAIVRLNENKRWAAREDILLDNSGEVVVD